MWDLDGPGPLAPMLVVGTAGLGGVMAWYRSNWLWLGSEQFWGSVNALAVYQGQLYATGDFEEIGVARIAYVARWNGSAWEQLGAGLIGTNTGEDYVNALEVYNGVLFVGGSFVPAETGLRTYCAAWDGSNWLSVPKPYTPINDFAVVGGQLYAATKLNSNVWGGGGGVNTILR